MMPARARRHDLTAVAAVLFLLAAMLFAWLRGGALFPSDVANPAQPGWGPGEERAGTIMVGRGTACRELSFNNDTGRVGYLGKCGPASEAARDDRGQGANPPEPAGTIRRLDAISKSFGRQDGR
jgi:hypothetical protein